MKKVIIKNIRNIKSLEFEIPSPGLHIVTGKNGTGKTTLFTCISRICNSNAYRVGFPSSSIKNLDVFSGSISYEVDGNVVKYSKRLSGEWRPDKKTTVLQDFKYPEIYNITTKNERIFSQEVIQPKKRSMPDIWLNEKLNMVFDTDKFSEMVRLTTGDLRGRHGKGITSESRRRNTAYAIPLKNDRYFTEQNFSFGEIVMLNLLHDVKNAVNGSLLLIDELELALHPSAQVRLINCLRELAEVKGLTIIISTHSSSIIKLQQYVILLDKSEDGKINVIYRCPPAKAIGAIGMREDTTADIIVLVEDKMAHGLFFALKQKYNQMFNENNYLDIRILEIGGFSNIIRFFVEAKNYIFYNCTYVVAFMDKDVKTDIIPYNRFANQDVIRLYNENCAYLKFLPDTPEVLLVKTYLNNKEEVLNQFQSTYNNQLLQYSVNDTFNFNVYEFSFPDFRCNEDYNNYIMKQGQFRKRCKVEAERIAKSLSDQINKSIDEVYRFTYRIAVDKLIESGFNLQNYLAATMKRKRP